MNTLYNDVNFSIKGLVMKQYGYQGYIGCTVTWILLQLVHRFIRKSKKIGLCSS